MGRHGRATRALGPRGAAPGGRRARGLDRQRVGAGLHVEDLLSYIRTGESRSGAPGTADSRARERPRASCCAPSPRWRARRATRTPPRRSRPSARCPRRPANGRMSCCRRPRRAPCGSWTADVTDRQPTETSLERRLAEYRDRTYQALLTQLPEPRAPALPVRPDLRPAVAHRQRGCVRRCASPPAARSAARSSRRCRPPCRSSCCTTRSSSTTTSRTAACTAATGPTLHVEHGVPIALNVGDAMNALSVRLADREHPGPGRRAGLPDLPRGAAPDPASRSRARRSSSAGRATTSSTSTEDDYLRMVLQEDLLVHAASTRCRIGALIGTGGRRRRRPLQPVRVPARRGLPDPGRRPQPGRRPRRATARRSSATSGRASGR